MFPMHITFSAAYIVKESANDEKKKDKRRPEYWALAAVGLILPFPIVLLIIYCARSRHDYGVSAMHLHVNRL